jgi:hypothetical protein
MERCCIPGSVEKSHEGFFQRTGKRGFVPYVTTAINPRPVFRPKALSIGQIISGIASLAGLHHILTARDPDPSSEPDDARKPTLNPLALRIHLLARRTDSLHRAWRRERTSPPSSVSRLGLSRWRNRRHRQRRSNQYRSLPIARARGVEGEIGVARNRDGRLANPRRAM